MPSCRIDGETEECSIRTLHGLHTCHVTAVTARLGARRMKYLAPGVSCDFESPLLPVETLSLAREPGV